MQLRKYRKFPEDVPAPYIFVPIEEPIDFFNTDEVDDTIILRATYERHAVGYHEYPTPIYILRETDLPDYVEVIRNYSEIM